MDNVISLTEAKAARSFPDADDPGVREMLTQMGAQLFEQNGVIRAVIHLMTQDDQGYGSERRCCERCGIMIAYRNDPPHWTDERKVYANPEKHFIRCDDIPRELRGKVLYGE